MTGADRHAPCLLRIEDVASRLHKSPRWMQDFLRQNPFGRMAGRTRLFTEADVAAIIEALPCPSNLSNATVPPSSISVAHPHPERPDRTIWGIFEEERPKLVPYRGRFDGFHALPASVSKTCLCGSTTTSTRRAPARSVARLKSTPTPIAS